MVESHCRVGCRTDQFRISDAPHTQYFADGIPVLLSTISGNIIEKTVHEYTLTCPLCSTDDHYEDGRYDDDEEPICENCGLVLVGDSVPRTTNGQPLLADAKAAGRVDPDTN